MKVNFYLLSMWLFYIIVIILSLPCFWEKENADVKMMILPALALLCLLYVSVFFGWLVIKRRNDSRSLSVVIQDLQRRDYETLAFLASYFIPLVSFNLDKIRHQLVLIVLFIAIGVIYIRGKMYFANPTLSLLGFKSYTVTITYQNGDVKGDIVLISTQALSQNDRVTCLKIDEGVFYAKIL